MTPILQDLAREAMSLLTYRDKGAWLEKKVQVLSLDEVWAVVQRLHWSWSREALESKYAWRKAFDSVLTIEQVKQRVDPERVLRRGAGDEVSGRQGEMSAARWPDAEVLRPQRGRAALDLFWQWLRASSGQVETLGRRHRAGSATLRPELQPGHGPAHRICAKPSLLVA